MRLPNLYYWSEDTKINGLLLFAQSIDEMLFNFTLDSYKAPICNVHFLLFELQNSLVEGKNMKLGTDGIKRYINPIGDELCLKISTDSVAKKIIENNYGKNGYKQIMHDIKNWDNYTEYSIFIESLRILFDNNYLDEIQKSLINSIKESDDFIEIRNLSQSYISELLTKGFAQEYIFYNSDSYFFKANSFSDCAKIEKYLLDFFALFPKEEREWVVIIRVSQEFKMISSIFNDEDDDFTSFLTNSPKPRKSDYFEKLFLDGNYHGLNRDFSCYIQFNKIKALDPHGAKEFAFFELGHYKNLLTYSTHYVQLKWDEIVLIYSSNDDPIVLKPTVSPLAKNKKFEKYYNLDIFSPDADLSKICDNKEELIFQKLKESQNTLYKSFSMHNSAINSKDTENQFISSWICLEVLLPYYYEGGLIEKFNKVFLPILNRRYIEKLVKNFYQDFDYFLNGRNEKMEDFFSDFPQIFQSYTDMIKCAALVSIIDQDNDLIEKAKSKIGRNPLLKLRLDILHGELRSAQMIKDTISMHNQRLEWQFIRLYRTRNLLTHLGQRTRNLNRLLENLSFYYHTIIDQIEEISRLNEHIISVESAYKWISVEYNAHNSHLEREKKKDCDYENFEKLLFGHMIHS